MGMFGMVGGILYLNGNEYIGYPGRTIVFQGTTANGYTPTVKLVSGR